MRPAAIRSARSGSCLRAQAVRRDARTGYVGATGSRRHQHRGVILVLVLIVLSVVTGLLVVLATSNAHRYRQRQIDRVRQVARAASDSAAAYARMQLPDWSARPPEGPVSLDVDALLAPRMTGSATVTLVTDQDRRVCRVTVRIDRGKWVATETVDLPMQ